MDAVSTPRLQFEGFTLDVAGRRLCAGDRMIELRAKSFDALCFLVERHGRLATKDEIIQTVWPNVVATDDSLAQCVSDIRRALGDSNQQIIKTVPGRGYVFTAPVSLPVTETSAGHFTAPPVGHAAVQLGRRKTLIATGSMLLAAAIALLIAATSGWLGNQPAQLPLPDRPSIAVLPFDSLSGDPDQEYFADAFTEDLITDLSRIRNAFVIARRTSFTFKGKAADMKKVAADLGVRYVLEGSVRRSGKQVRINAQLIDGQTGGHVWSDRYDRVLTDVFSVQNDVTGQIAAVLKAELREAESQRQVPSASLEAWDYALRGNVLLFNPKSRKDFQDAKALLEKAAQLDPSIASAWSGLAFVHFAASLRPIPGVSVPNSKDLSLEAAQKAVSLDPKDAEGHWMVGVGYARNGQPERGLASCETAMDLNPNNDCAYVCAGLANMALGKSTEALPHFRQSLRLNPRFRPFTKHTYMGLAYLHSGQDMQAITELNRAIAGSPANPIANFALTSALALIGRVEDARAALEKSMMLAYSDQTTIETLRTSHSWMGPGFERVLEGLRVAGMPEQ